MKNFKKSVSSLLFKQLKSNFQEMFLVLGLPNNLESHKNLEFDNLG